MKLVGVIPSRYHSIRFPGKALAVLNDKPMFYHVYMAAKQSAVFDEIYVATDSELIVQACKKHLVPVLMTDGKHLNPTSRIHEVSSQVDADLYLMLGGDEPMLLPEDIRMIASRAADALNYSSFLVVNAMTEIQDIAEALDPSNIKVVCNETHEGLYLSRSPIPFPHGNLNIPYRKFVSIGAYTKESLDFFVSVPPGTIELTEGCDLLRFLEYHKHILFVDIGHHTLSVDTPKDLERVKLLLKERQPDTFLSNGGNDNDSTTT